MGILKIEDYVLTWPHDIINKCNKKSTPAKIIAVISNNAKASGLKLKGKFDKIAIDNKLNKKKIRN